MSDLTTVTAREANQRFSELLSAVETEGRSFVVTKHGRPVARLVPVAERKALTPEQEAALQRLLNTSWNLGGERFSRDELHER